MAQLKDLVVSGPSRFIGQIYGPNSTTQAAGLLPQLSGDTAQFLRADGTWVAPSGTTYGNATTESAGLMTADMVKKLNGIATGANAYTLPYATTTTLGGVVVGSNLTVSATGVISLTKANVTGVLGLTPTANTGTVTSVRVQATSPVVSSTNTAQTSSLNTTISLADAYGDTKNPYGTKTANTVLAGPVSGNAAAPSFRALVAADIPVMVGASSTTAGTKGAVPAPATGNVGQYLRGDGTWATPTNTTYEAASSSTTGLLTSALYDKLVGIATGANAYSLPTAAAAVLGGVKVGTGLTISATGVLNHSNSITAQSTQAIYPIKIDAQGHISGYGTAVTPLTASSTLNAAKLSGTIPAGCYTNTTYSLATTQANGLLKQLSGTATQYLQGNGNWGYITAIKDTTSEQMVNVLASGTGKMTDPSVLATWDGYTLKWASKNDVTVGKALKVQDNGNAEAEVTITATGDGINQPAYLAAWNSYDLTFATKNNITVGNATTAASVRTTSHIRAFNTTTKGTTPSSAQSIAFNVYDSTQSNLISKFESYVDAENRAWTSLYAYGQASNSTTSTYLSIVVTNNNYTYGYSNAQGWVIPSSMYCSGTGNLPTTNLQTGRIMFVY